MPQKYNFSGENARHSALDDVPHAGPFMARYTLARPKQPCDLDRLFSEIEWRNRPDVPDKPARRTARRLHKASRP